jgi:beta-glucosidase
MGINQERFIWGAASSSTQIEGGVQQDGRGDSIWDTFSRVSGKVYQGHTPAIACDHRNRWKEDLRLMKEIGLKAYRFSVSWSRILPQGEGKVSESGMRFYEELVDGLLDAGIEPWVTLYHWDLPQRLQDQGGWLNPEASEWFANYAGRMSNRLSDRVRNWITINEPQVIVGCGMALGTHAPGIKLGLKDCLVASKNLFRAHAEGVRAIRSEAKAPVRTGWAPVGVLSVPVGVGISGENAARKATFSLNQPGEGSPQEVMDCLWNSAMWMDPMFLGRMPDCLASIWAGHLPDGFDDGWEKLVGTCDFFACNVYHARYVDSDEASGFRPVNAPVGTPKNTLGWDIVPEALYWAAKFYWERYGMPVIFTENGSNKHAGCLCMMKLGCRRRVKIGRQEAVYHVISRTAYQRYSLGDGEKEMFVRMMRRQAEFCGVEVLAYCVMSNHFHLLVKVPYVERISDEELIRRYRLMYSDEKRSMRAIAPEEWKNGWLKAVRKGSDP